MEKAEIIKLWKEKKIEQVVMDFYCGGDSMGDTTFRIIFDNGEEEDEYSVDETLSPIIKYFNDEVYNEVEFYEASDGYYMGEAGQVYIELDDDDKFIYSKSAEMEFNESFTSTIKIDLTDEEVAFLSDKVSNINGGYDENVNINYKKDFILTDKLKELVENLTTKIEDITKNFVPEDDDLGELQEWYNFETEDDFLVGNNLIISITNQHTIYRSE